MKHTNLTYAAFLFAKEAHGRIGQKRKYTNDPYIVHPVAVAEIVAEAGGDEEMIAAALLHDTVEDTGTTIEQIERKFGPGVAGLVAELTDVSKPSDGNRAVRKRIDLDHTAAASARAQTVKLADLIHNSASILAHDDHFAATYMPEKKRTLAVLTKGSPKLQTWAAKIVETWEAGR